MVEVFKQILAILLSSIVIQILPIKIDPWTWLIKWIGNLIYGDIRRSLIELSLTVDQNEIDRIRYEIMEFANSCRNHRRHTKDEFHHIVELNTKYHLLIKKHKIANGVLDAEYAYIEKTYLRCQEKGVFDKFKGEDEDE